MATPLHILHLHSSFGPGGKELRSARLMNAFGAAARHTIVSAMPDQVGARDAIAPGIRYEIAQDAPPLTGGISLDRFERIARFMRRFDLVLTYNWGAIDGVMAARMYPKGAPPVVHHEDGFNTDELRGPKPSRNMYRRVALAAAKALVVPSQTLEEIALDIWKQPPAKVHRIVNGIAIERYAGSPEPGAIPGFARRDGEVVIGTIAGLRPVKNLPLLVRAVGGVPSRTRLVIVGEGPERATIEQAAAAMGIADRTLLPGFLPDPHRFIGHFDLLALSSASEQFPVAVVEAMAAGLPVASTPVGDVSRMMSELNYPYVAKQPTEVMLRDCIQALASDEYTRRTVGAANRRKAAQLYDEATMIAAYRGVYEAALGKSGALA